MAGTLAFLPSGRATDRVRHIGLRILCSVGLIILANCSKENVEPLNNSASPQEYQLGKKILFGEAGDSEKYRASGWSHTEKDITWTEGTSAVLQFSGLPAATSLRLKMTLAALVKPPELPSQPVEVVANGEKVADWNVSDKGEFSVLIPSHGDTGTLKVELRIPKAVSPKDLGLSSDVRDLGVCCFDLVINKAG